MRRSAFFEVGLWSLLFVAYAPTALDAKGQRVTPEPSTAASDKGPSSATPGPFTGDLRVFNKTVLHIKDNYYDPTRVKPKEMLLASLKAIETASPTVHVQGPSSSGIVTVRVDARTNNFDISGVDSLWKMSVTLYNIVVLLATAPSTSSQLGQIEAAATNGMLSALDPHSLLIITTRYEQMRSDTLNFQSNAPVPESAGVPRVELVQGRMIAPNIGYLRLPATSRS